MSPDWSMLPLCDDRACRPDRSENLSAAIVFRILCNRRLVWLGLDDSGHSVLKSTSSTAKLNQLRRDGFLS